MTRLPTPFLGSGRVRYYGNEKAIRQMPRHWHIEDPDAHWDAARGMFWLVVKTLAVTALVVVAYAVVAA